MIASLYVASSPPAPSWKHYLFIAAALVSNFSMFYAGAALFIFPLCMIWPRRGFLTAVTLLVFVSLQILTIIDTSIYRLFKFHINGMVINLFLTEGADDSVDLGWATWSMAGVVLLAFILFELWLINKLYRRCQAAPEKPIPWRYWSTVALFLLATVIIDKTAYAVSDLYNLREITRYGRLFPFYQPLTIKGFAEEDLGFKVEREHLTERASHGSTLNYPKQRPSRTPLPNYPNILMIIIDAWRYDMLDPEITPHISSFSNDALVFKRHFSGGNSSRFGIFSLLYSLYGSYWHHILNERQSPVLIDELLDLGYQFKVMSSTRLTYPEFRRSAFVRIPEAIEDNITGYRGGERDPKLAKGFVEWLKVRDKTRPFFSFLFFDAPHAPYTYPPRFAKFSPAIPAANYVTVGQSDMPRLKNAYQNAIYLDDYLTGEILAELKLQGLLQNTIVLISGDHGEEFFEHGHYGHTSSFSDKQTKVPLVLYVPNREPGTIDYQTSHLDVVPTLMELLGYTSPPEQYSQGQSLLSVSADRPAVSMGWDKGAIIDGQNCIIFSTETYNSGHFEIRDSEYRLVENEAQVLRSKGNVLAQTARGMGEFLR
ncbi:MAG: sulfatase-like hydrolase/transferase [Deltaproteobacteria bacterium]|nr:sulfatase-like hydrolase/transferase [Deltaproteobacteria bacterium]